VKEPADAEAHQNVDRAMDNAPTELLEMFEEAHAIHFFRGTLLSGFYDGT
jgi:hypothetical protein